LAAHIRNRHTKQYPKWLKTPSRLADAQKAAAVPEAAKQAPEPPAQPLAVHGEATVLSHPAATDASPTLDLLKRAHAQLIDRKQSIEAELARLADLTKELDTVNTQIQALDKALGVFKT
jgi:predicted phage-related endonuclease